jgi:hypothetical protein
LQGKCYVGYMQGFTVRYLWIVLLANTIVYAKPPEVALCDQGLCNH